MIWKNGQVMTSRKKGQTPCPGLPKQAQHLKAQSQNLLLIMAMMQGRQQERQRIAEELHDRLGCLLSTIKLHCNTLSKTGSQRQTGSRYRQVLQLLDKAVEEVRNISHDVASGVLAQFGLTRALEDLKHTVESTRQLEVKLNLIGLEKRLDETVELAVFRSIQELLCNVTRHAAATAVTIQLTRRSQLLNVMVEDNGKGFDPVTVRYNDGMGVRSIASRMEVLGGSFELDAAPGQGCTAIMELEI